MAKKRNDRKAMRRLEAEDRAHDFAADIRRVMKEQNCSYVTAYDVVTSRRRFERRRDARQDPAKQLLRNLFELSPDGNDYVRT